MKFIELYREECQKADQRWEQIVDEAEESSRAEWLPEGDLGDRLRLAREAGHLRGMLKIVLYELACEKALASEKCSAPNAD